jgi:hypothetical protein
VKRLLRLGLCACLLAFPSASVAAPGSDATVSSPGSFRLNGGSRGGQTTNCGPGRALGGGLTGSGDRAGYIEFSGPLGPAGTASGTGLGAVPTQWHTNTLISVGNTNELRSLVVCSQNSDATIGGLATLSPAGGGTFAAAMQCPAGTRAVGGGVVTDSTDPDDLTAASGPLDDTGTTAGTVDGDVPRYWYVNVLNGTGSRTYYGYAICSAASDAVLETTDMPVAANFNAQSQVAHCPAGRRALSGGYGVVNVTPESRLISSVPVDDTGQPGSTAAGDVPRGWFASIENLAGSPAATYKVMAVCATDPLAAQPTKKKCKKKRKTKRRATPAKKKCKKRR